VHNFKCHKNKKKGKKVKKSKIKKQKISTSIKLILQFISPSHKQGKK
jgi:hypothetical protein